MLEVSKPDPILSRSISVLCLSNRTTENLISSGIRLVGDLVKLSKNQLLRLPLIGKKALDEITEVLLAKNLRLNMRLDNWPPVSLKAWIIKIPDEDEIYLFADDVEITKNGVFIATANEEITLALNANQWVSVRRDINR